MTCSTTDTVESLTDELRAFCDKEGLPQDSADDLLTNPAITEPQRQWLTDFCERWDAMNQPNADWDVDNDDLDADDPESDTADEP